MLIYWFISLIIKLILVCFVPLTADENYYWVWTQKLELSYFDHPPFVAWLFKLGNYLPGFMLKWPAVLFAHLAFLIWICFLKNIGFNQEQQKKWFLLSLFAPLVGMASLVLTPDLPVLFFYSTAIFAFERALNTEKLLYYILFGLSIGIGFTAKYHIVLVLLCLLAYLIIQKELNKVKWKAVLLSVIFMIFGALPVLYWNSQHDWISFRFQLQHGLGKNFWKPFWPIDYLLTILLFIFPAYWFLFYKSVKEYQQRLLIYLSLPIFVFFLFSSFRAKVEGNWSQLAFMPTLALIAFYDDKAWRLKSYISVWSLALAVLVFFWRQPRFPQCPEKLCEPHRYQILKEVEKQYHPLFTSSYQMASYLWFQNKRPSYKLFDMSRTDFYDTFSESKPIYNEFFLVRHKHTNIPTWVNEHGFSNELVKIIDDDLELIRFYR